MPEGHLRRLEALLAAEAVLATPSDSPDLRGYAAISEQYHLALVATASNRVLLDLYQRLHAYVVMERAQHGSFSDQVVLDHSEHVAIVAALRQGNRAGAAMLLTAHLDRVRAFTLGMYRAK
jgi:DNA-binding GntR family transcriptional regulator